MPTLTSTAMGHSAMKTSSTKLKFPLGLVSPTVRPYLELIRIEKPAGTLLTWWPFAWALTMAARRTNLPPEAYAMGLVHFLVWSFIMRSLGCTVNDIVDRKVDAKVARTRVRPLPSGRITLFAAVTFLIAQYAVGILFLVCSVKGLALQVGLFQMIPLVIGYPFMKRLTDWPQAWLGFGMSFGFVTAWVATTGSFDIGVIASGFIGNFFWVLLYDTIYACQDIKDDIKAGVRSTAILFGSWIKPLLVIYGLLFVGALAAAGYFNNQGVLYYLISVGGTFANLVWQYKTVDLENPASCWKNFVRNGQLGWLIWAGQLADYAVSASPYATI